MSSRAERLRRALPKAWDELQQRGDNLDNELRQRLSVLVTDDFLPIPRLSSTLRPELLGTSEERRLQYFALASKVQELMLLEHWSEQPATGPVVLVDMDGVIADYDGYTEAQIALEIPELPPLERGLGPYIADRLPADVTDEIRQRVLAIQYAKGHFTKFAPIDGAYDAWVSMQEWGYHPRICSAPLTQNLWTLKDKIWWLDNNWHQGTADDAIIQRDKASQDGITLIDDMPAVREAERAIWQHTVFHTDANASVDTPYRLESWRDLTTLKNILADCALRYDELTR